MAEGMGDFKTLVKNRKFQVAAGGVGVVGGVVWYMRRKSGTASGANTGSPTVPVGSTGYVQGGADTTGTDLASFLSNYSQSLTDQQNAWAAQWSGNLGDTLQAIKDAAAGGSLTPPAGGTTQQTANVLAGYHVDQWITDMQRHGVKISWSQLLAANPNIWKYIKNDGTGKTSGNVFTSNQTFKLS